jgi:hypothetical protein
MFKKTSCKFCFKQILELANCDREPREHYMYMHSLLSFIFALSEIETIIPIIRKIGLKKQKASFVFLLEAVIRARLFT